MPPPPFLLFQRLIMSGFTIAAAAWESPRLRCGASEFRGWIGEAGGRGFLDEARGRGRRSRVVGLLLVYWWDCDVQFVLKTIMDRSIYFNRMF